MVYAALILLLATMPAVSETVPMLIVSHTNGPMLELHVEFHTDGRVERGYANGYVESLRLDPRDRYRLRKFMESQDFEAVLRGLDAMAGPHYTCTDDVGFWVRGELHGYSIPTDCPSREVIEFIHLLNDVMTRGFGADAELPIDQVICSAPLDARE